MSDWHEDYRRRYEALKREGKPFFPYAVFKDTLVAFIIVTVLLALAHFKGATLEPLADPTDSEYNPRPEWYFMFLFQALKFFPGHLEAVAAVILPGATVLTLCLVPFLDRGPRRHFRDRPFWTVLGLTAIGGFAALTWAGLKSPLTNPVEEKDPQVTAGRRLYSNLNCVYCHRIAGKGGSIGPELDKVAWEETPEWLTRHFKDPRSVSPGSVMPKMNLLDDEIHVLVAYMKSLAPAEEPYTDEAPKLFTENCAACHRIGTEGGDSGPDLSAIGAAREKSYIKKYLLDPTLVYPASAMPGYKGQLTDIQLEDLARYLKSRR